MSSGRPKGSGSTSRKGQGRGGRKLGANSNETFGLGLIFDILREDGIEVLPPAVKAKVKAIKARRRCN
jgi:hypothetical protein